eukprot:1651274-Pleurochrysis_carterae.AAC.2
MAGLYQSRSRQRGKNETYDMGSVPPIPQHPWRSEMLACMSHHPCRRHAFLTLPHASVPASTCDAIMLVKMNRQIAETT